MSVSQSIARPVRTATQLGFSAVVVEFVDAFLIDFSERQYAAALGLLTVVFGWVQVLVENSIGKAFLRKPEPPATPVDVVENNEEETRMERYHGESGAFETSWVVGAAALIVILVGIVWLIQNLG